MGQDRVREPDVGRPRAQDSHKGAAEEAGDEDSEAERKGERCSHLKEGEREGGGR